MFRIHRPTWLLGLALTGLLLAFTSTAAQAVLVSVDPPDTTVACGDTISIRIHSTDAFTDLKAYQLIFRFNASVLRYLGPVAGGVLTDNGRPYTMRELPDVVAPEDTAWVDCAQLVGSTSTPGVLVEFWFETLTAGVSPIACLMVDFRDSWNQQTLPDCLGGLVRVLECPVPARPVSWGTLKTIYR